MQQKNRTLDVFFILLVTGIFSFAANWIGNNPDLAKSSIGVSILVAITFIGYLVSRLPVANKLPAIFWVSIIGVVASLPSVPGSEVLLSYTKEVGFLALTTPLLAYAGLSIGKDMEAFKRLSWRIVPVALAVAAGSFLCATMLAEVILHLEGIF